MLERKNIKQLGKKVKTSYKWVAFILWYAKLSKIIKTGGKNAPRFCQRRIIIRKPLPTHSWQSSQSITNVLDYNHQKFMPDKVQGLRLQAPTTERNSTNQKYSAL